MALFGLAIWFCAAAFFLQSCVLAAAANKLYIVHMDTNLMPNTYNTQSDWYADHLQTLTAAQPEKIVYNYKDAYHGFAANLSPEEADALRQSDAVLGVYEDRVYELHTTRTPQFLGLNGEVPGHTLQQLNLASQDVIIGVLDTGIWPNSTSLNDAGMSKVPSRWRGKCEGSFCNRKLIGARSFVKGYRAMAATVETLSVIDEEGHGTHTASTAAGAVVPNVNFFGYASGTASGMAPYARLAAYKVCGKNGCSSTDILAGIEGAIQDGVDVLSMSLGGPPTVYYEDPIALGTFAAMEKGIFVSCSAGNSGPGESTVSNGAPWIMTVGASTIDRNFPGYVTLGNNKSFTGVSLYSGKSMGKELVELVYGNLCKPRSLDAAQVKGKVVVCDRENNHLARLQKGAVVKSAGGMGMILANTKESGGEGPVVDSHVLPAVAVGLSAGNEIRNYVKTDKNPMAVLSFGGTMVNVKPAPVVAAFSSRGPNNVTREILKPDVIGPGVGILAAWTEAASISGLPKDPRRSPFNIISGTSMSCPHISGLAALVKAAHPDWSPSAIKSALMTTAYTLDNNNNSPISDANDKSNATPHAMGAGHVDPIKALSPGLVYNTTLNDYLAFLCSLGYSPKDIQTITKSRNLTCAKLKSKFKSPAELNYPSFSVLFNNARVVRLTRKLTSVDPGFSVYNVLVKAPPSVKVTVNPTRLVFKDVGDSLSYTVTFRSESVSHEDAFGSILWNNEKHTVTSPVAYSWH